MHQAIWGQHFQIQKIAIDACPDYIRAKQINRYYPCLLIKKEIAQNKRAWKDHRSCKPGRYLPKNSGESEHPPACHSAANQYERGDSQEMMIWYKYKQININNLFNGNHNELDLRNLLGCWWLFHPSCSVILLTACLELRIRSSPQLRLGLISGCRSSQSRFLWICHSFLSWLWWSRCFRIS